MSNTIVSCATCGRPTFQEVTCPDCKAKAKERKR